MQAPLPTEGLPANAGTTIMLLHKGYPNNPAEALQHLASHFQESGVPQILTSSMAELYWKKYSTDLHHCIDNSQSYPSFEDTLTHVSTNLQSILANFTPEFGPFRVHFTSLDTSFEDSITDIIKNGTDSLFLVSLYPLYNKRTGSMLSRINDVLQKQTKTKDYPSEDIARTSHVSSKFPTTFDCTRLVNIGAMSQIVHYFAEKILLRIEDCGADSVIFAVPLPDIRISKAYCEQVTSISQRIVYSLLERSLKSVDWRVAFYKSWEQLPSTQKYPTIHDQVKHLRKYGNQTTLILPLLELFPGFDTETTLPKLVFDHEDLVLVQPITDDKALLHSIADMIKSELLTISQIRSYD
uniref:Ferrochelatase n=1 Tax=Acrobeloides nanus TaxID=290746 RepID=A0A914D8S3_9BILA